ncbi:hypothetical protein T06_4784 [Trichinella sp. T6]|nr:hypothetical protein T06_4784 [Trichinella sp. T6]
MLMKSKIRSLDAIFTCGSSAMNGFIIRTMKVEFLDLSCPRYHFNQSLLHEMEMKMKNAARENFN